MSFPILSLVTFLPLVGAAAVLLIRGDEQQVATNSRWVALWTSIITFIVSLFLLNGFDPNVAGFQMIEQTRWLPEFNVSYKLGVDGISLWFVLASSFLTPVCVLASWKAVTMRVRDFMIALLVLETMMVGMFVSLDLIVFYLFFEGSLLPMFLMIGVWGGQRRVHASYKFFLYTLLGSLLMLLALVAVVLNSGTTDIEVLLQTSLPREMQFWVFLAFFVAFAVKSPMWPLHTWLPDAHVEAPTAGSVMLAGILLKFAGYGLIRFNVGMMPEAAEFFAPMIFTLSVIAIIYASLVAFVQDDMKKLVAYSSIAHMGYVTLGIFSLNQQGLEGAVMVMLSHALVSSALFLGVGVMYDRLHTREIKQYGGLAHSMPMFAIVFMIFTLASVGLPGTSGFVGEFLSMAGAFQVNTWITALAAVGVVLGALYMLSLYRQIFLGPLEKAEIKAMPDINAREMSYLIPIIVLILWMGIYPKTFQDKISTTVAHMVEAHQERIMTGAAEPFIPVDLLLAAVQGSKP